MPQYQLADEKNNGNASGRPFTLYQAQISQLGDLQTLEQRKQSPIVRDAIEFYWLLTFDEKLSELRQITSMSSMELVHKAIDLLHAKIETITFEPIETQNA